MFQIVIAQTPIKTFPLFFYFATVGRLVLHISYSLKDYIFELLLSYSYVKLDNRKTYFEW